jgi:hypothetical protein
MMPLIFILALLLLPPAAGSAEMTPGPLSGPAMGLVRHALTADFPCYSGERTAGRNGW